MTDHNRPRRQAGTILVRGLLMSYLVFTVTACVSLTAEQIERRELQQLLFEQHFLKFRHQCYLAGGRVYIDAAQSLGHDGIPGRNDNFFCGRAR